MTASQQPTGHDKAVEAVRSVLDDFDTVMNVRLESEEIAHRVLAALRAALAAGDANVAEALGLTVDRQTAWYLDKATEMRRFVTDWTEA